MCKCNTFNGLNVDCVTFLLARLSLQDRHSFCHFFSQPKHNAPPPIKMVIRKSNDKSPFSCKTVKDSNNHKRPSIKRQGAAVTSFGCLIAINVDDGNVSDLAVELLSHHLSSVSSSVTSSFDMTRSVVDCERLINTFFSDSNKSVRTNVRPRWEPKQRQSGGDIVQQRW
jgi:hypothetical protein